MEFLPAGGFLPGPGAGGGGGGSGITAIAAGTTLATGPTVTLADSNGIAFGAAGNIITASVGLAFGVSTGGNTNGNTGTFGAPLSVVFVGAGNVTLTQQTAPGAITVIVNATLPMTSGSGAFIAAGTQTATSGTVVFSNSNGVSFGMSASSVVTASVSVATMNVFEWQNFQTHNTVWPGLASFQHVSIPAAISASSGVILLELLGNSGSSGGLSLYIGAYRMTLSTASNLTSQSAGFTWTSGSDTTASSLYGGVSGTRYRSFGWPVSLSAGDYLFAFAISTENDGTARIFGRQGANIVGSFVGAETLYFLDGHSNSTVAAFPPTLVANNTNYVRTGLSAQRQPAFVLYGTN